MFRSSDGGQTWIQLPADFGALGISDLAFDPQDPARMYVASYERGLLLSTDAAVSFTRVGPEPTDPTRDGPYRVAISTDGQTIYYFTLGSKLLTSTDGGASFNEQELPSPPRALAISPASGAVLYVGTASGVLKTTNSGATWSNLPNPSLFSSWIEGIAIVPGTPHQLWVATDENLFSTDNDGQNWTALAPALPDRKLQQDASDPTRLYATEIFGRHEQMHVFQVGSWVPRPAFKDQAYCVAASPTNASVLIVGAANGVWRSENDGVDWARSNIGLAASDMRSIVATNGVIYAGGSHGELVRAVGDADFEAVSTSAAFPLTNRNVAIYSLAVQPSNANVIVAATAFGGLMTSHDAGKSWANGSADLITAIIDAVAFDPSDESIVYASGVPAFGSSPHVLYRSRDAGLSFAPLANNLPTTSRIGGIAVDPGNSNRLFAGALWTSIDPEIDGLWRSEDAGATWTKVHENAGTNSVAVHPRDANIVYAILAEGSVVMSDDGGDSFESTMLPLSPIGTPLHLALDPVAPNVIYVLASNRTGTTTEYHILRSVDYGASWERIQNAPVQGWVPRQLAVDKDRPTVIHATSTRGVHSYEMVTDVRAVIFGHDGGKPAGAESSVGVVLTHDGVFAATNVRSEIRITGSVQLNSATIANGSCTVTANVATCSVPFVKAPNPVTAEVKYTPTAAGAVAVQVTVQSREHDYVPENNVPSATASFAAAPSPSPPPAPTPTPTPAPRNGGGGGSGSTSLLLLFVLQAIGLLARARRHRVHV